MADLNTYGDLKKVIKSIALKQKGEKIGNVALGTVIGLIPGADAAKTTFEFIRAAISKPDTKKTGTWLDKLDIDDQMSAIVDDTVENGFMKTMAASIEKESDDKPLESDFNMNAQMVNYLKQQYAGRTVAGIKEEQRAALKSAIKAYAREIMMNEENVTGSGASFSAGSGENYATPYAFGKKKGENRAVKFLKKMGWKVADLTLPKNSKLFDYKKIFENMSSEEAVNQLKSLLSHTLKHDKLSGDFSEWLNKVKEGDDEILDRMWDLAGSSVDRHAINVLSKPKPMKESLLNVIDQGILNEVSYGKFKKEVTYRTKSEQLHKAIREVKRKLAEIDRIVEYTSRMKQELSEGEDGIKYWKATQKNVSQISEMVNHLNNKIKNLNQ